MANTSCIVKVAGITPETDRVSTFELTAADGGTLPPFTAGAHIDLHLGNGLVRSYSLLNDPAENHRYVIAVQKEVDGRGGSLYMHDALGVGDTLKVDCTENRFELCEDAKHSVLIAGGIGITPLMAMVARLRRLNRSWELHYVARTRRDAAFIGALEAFGDRNPSPVRFYATREAGGGRPDIAAIVAAAGLGTHFYCCGPLPMLKDFETAAPADAAGRFHREHFSSEEAPALYGGFEVELRRSGKVLMVIPGKTILDTLLEHKVSVSFSCSEGMCGSCLTAVIDGVPDHRDQFLTDEEKAGNDRIMICCSGARSQRLVLDL